MPAGGVLGPAVGREVRRDSEGQGLAERRFRGLTMGGGVGVQWEAEGLGHFPQRDEPSLLPNRTGGAALPRSAMRDTTANTPRPTKQR